MPGMEFEWNKFIQIAREKFATFFPGTQYGEKELQIELKILVIDTL